MLFYYVQFDDGKMTRKEQEIVQWINRMTQWIMSRHSSIELSLAPASVQCNRSVTFFINIVV